MWLWGGSIFKYLLKFSETIVLPLIFISFFLFSFKIDENKRVNDNGIELLISIDKDTCYYSKSVIKISLVIKNEKMFPFFVRESMGVSSFHHDSEMIFINIKQKKKRYIQVEPLVRNVSQSKYMILKNRPYKREYVLDFRKLIEKEQADSLFKSIGIKYIFSVDNKNFGTYQIQAMYLSSKNDTVYSNIVKVVYLP